MVYFSRYSVTTLTVSRGGRFSPSLSFLSRLNTAEILENTPLNSVVLSLAWVAGTAAHRPVQFSIDRDELPGREFSVSSRGEVILRKTVDFETRESYEFSVMASDGWHNDTTRVRINLININDWDPRFRHPEYAFYVSRENMVSGHKVGEVEVHFRVEGEEVGGHPLVGAEEGVGEDPPYHRAWGVEEGVGAHHHLEGAEEGVWGHYLEV